jgi:hypothetical protein
LDEQAAWSKVSKEDEGGATLEYRKHYDTNGKTFARRHEIGVKN